MAYWRCALEDLVVNQKFWDSRRVLVTGQTGFKGSWLSLALQMMGAHVSGYALRPPTEPSLFEVARVGDGMRSVEGDIRDISGLRDLISAQNPEVVFHLAAQSLVRPSYDDPVETYSTNVMGTVNVLEAVRRIGGVRVVVVVTSDKCYQNNEWIWGYRENEPVGGYDPYSSSKGCAELVTSAFRNSYFHPRTYASHQCGVATARAGNVIGGGDWATDRLVPDIVGAFMAGQPAIIRNPQSVRPWQHVLESISGYLLLAERLWGDGESVSEAWNFGAEYADSRTVEWIVERLAQLWGEGSCWNRLEEPDRSRHEAHLLRLDSSKSRARLGWKPLLDIATALDWTVSWFKAYQAGRDMRTTSLTHIERYLQMGER